MSRLHVHIRVQDLAASIDYYSRLFGQAPDRQEDDYARWRLDEPSVNLAVSTGCGDSTGVQHLGLDMDDAEELAATAERMRETRRDEQDVACCYARSDKHWFEDPDGVSWETFHSHGRSQQLEAGPAEVCCA